MRFATNIFMSSDDSVHKEMFHEANEPVALAAYSCAMANAADEPIASACAVACVCSCCCQCQADVREHLPQGMNNPVQEDAPERNLRMVRQIEVPLLRRMLDDSAASVPSREHAARASSSRAPRWPTERDAVAPPPPPPPRPPAA